MQALQTLIEAISQNQGNQNQGGHQGGHQGGNNAETQAGQGLHQGGHQRGQSGHQGGHQGGQAQYTAHYDQNAQSHINIDQARLIVDTLKSAGFEPKKILTRYKVKKYSELTQGQFIEIMDKFKQYAQCNNQTGQNYHGQQGNYS